MFCENCGAKLDSDTRFCHSCGKQLDGYSQKSKTGNWLTRLYQGRINRKYWILGTLFWLAALFVIIIVGALLLTSSGDNNDMFTWFFLIAIIIFYYLGLGLSVRRFHDMNQTGWMVLVFIIPLVNLIMLVYMLTTEGVKSSNKYGALPSSDLGFFKTILNR